MFKPQCSHTCLFGSPDIAFRVISYVNNVPGFDPKLSARGSSMMIVSHRSKVTQIGDVDLISYSFLVSGSTIDSHRNARRLKLRMAVEEIRVTTAHSGLPGTTSNRRSRLRFL